MMKIRYFVLVMVIMWQTAVYAGASNDVSVRGINKVTFFVVTETMGASGPTFSVFLFRSIHNRGGELDERVFIPLEYSETIRNKSATIKKMLGLNQGDRVSNGFCLLKLTLTETTVPVVESQGLSHA